MIDSGFIHAVMHVILFVVLHARRVKRRPVAQKQSTRLISERTRSVTARDDHRPRSGVRYQVSDNSAWRFAPTDLAPHT